MKKRSFTTSLVLVLTVALLSSLSWAGQVVTEKVKSWAKEAVQQEKTLKTTVTPNTVAILYFHNKTEWSKLDLLQKGLALMLITDLSNVRGIQVLERVKLQALVEELGFGTSGLVASNTAPRVGGLLGVEHLVGGEILKSKMDEFQLKSDVLKVPTESILGQPVIEGTLLAELFRMEKDLLFEIVRLLKIELTREQVIELKEPISPSIEALLFLFQGIENSDLKNYIKANQFYEKALSEDPNLTPAKQAIHELHELHKVAEEEKGANNRVKCPPKKGCAQERNELRNFLRRR